MKKICRKCTKNKDINNFHHRKAAKDGRASWCIPCTRSYNRLRWLKERDIQLARTKNWRKNNRKWTRRYERLRILSSHDLSEKQFLKMLHKQKKRCAICGKTRADKKRKSLHIDHDHKTNRVRGLLCVNCNVGLGKFMDSVHLLRKAIRYLQRSK